VSEVLQSQLLQPVNAAALPPQLQQIRSPLLMGSGPITPSFQEFNPLFAGDRHTFSFSGVAGSGDTWADEGSGLSLMIEYITSLPGERGRHTFERRSRDGIPIPLAIQGELETLAKRLGVAMFPSSSR